MSSSVSIVQQARRLLPTHNGNEIAAHSDYISLLTRHAKSKARANDGELLLQVLERATDLDLDGFDHDAHVAGSFMAKIRVAADENRSRDACAKWSGLKENARAAAKGSPNGEQKVIHQRAWRGYGKNLNAAQAALRNALAAQEYLKRHMATHWWAPDVVAALLAGHTPVRVALRLDE